MKKPTDTAVHLSCLFNPQVAAEEYDETVLLQPHHRSRAGPSTHFNQRLYRTMTSGDPVLRKNCTQLSHESECDW